MVAFNWIVTAIVTVVVVVGAVVPIVVVRALPGGGCPLLIVSIAINLTLVFCCVQRQPEHKSSSNWSNSSRSRSRRKEKINTVKRVSTQWETSNTVIGIREQPGAKPLEKKPSQ